MFLNQNNRTLWSYSHLARLTNQVFWGGFRPVSCFCCCFSHRPMMKQAVQIQFDLYAAFTWYQKRSTSHLWSLSCSSALLSERTEIMADGPFMSSFLLVSWENLIQAKIYRIYFVGAEIFRHFTIRFQNESWSTFFSDTDSGIKKNYFNIVNKTIAVSRFFLSHRYYFVSIQQILNKSIVHCIHINWHVNIQLADDS